MAVSKKNRIAQKDRKKQQHFNHVAFLLEAADIEGLPERLRNHYRFISKQVGNKTQVRLHKKYKRQMCQRCGAEFPKNLNVEKNKCGYFEHTCKLCHFHKNVQIKPNPKSKK